MHEPHAKAPQDDPGGPTLVGPARLAGKYVTFELAGKVYGVGIARVREFVGLAEIISAPRAPAFVRGVIQVRGAIVPVIDLRVRLGLPGAGSGTAAVVIVVECRVGGRPIAMGVLVDRVLGVVTLGPDTVDPPPTLGDGAPGADLFLGVARLSGRVVFMLDVAAMLCGAAAELPNAMRDDAVSSR